MRTVRTLGLAVSLAALAACSGVKPPPTLSHPPRSILVTPAINETTDVAAGELYRTTVSRPLAEQGYYVFPVLLTDALLEDLGLPDAGQVRQLPPERFHELFGADAVLFVSIKDWSNKYLLLQAQTVVELDFVLVDARSGTVMWERNEKAIIKTGSSGGGLIGAAVEAAVTYATKEMTEGEHRPLALRANYNAFSGAAHGLPKGPYRIQAETSQGN